MRSLFKSYTKQSKPSQEDHADEALDTVASLLRTTGDYAFALDAEDSETFRTICDTWARHILTGTPPPNDSAGDNTERQWAKVRHFYRERRRQEQEFVHRNIDGFKDMVSELAGNLKAIHDSHRLHSSSMASSMEQLEVAAASDSLEDIRNAIQTAIFTVQTTMDQQQNNFEAEMSMMGTKLSTMRSALLDTRREMSMDPLTQVYNRGAFDKALQHYTNLGVVSGHPITLLMIDLDHFKNINDTYGHPAGDKVLQMVANRIVRTYPRKNDFIARYGGEEFAVILYDVGSDNAPRLTEQLLRNIRQLTIPLPNGGILRTTCSIGCALLAPDEASESLLERADAALYQAKNSGRDKVCIADPKK